MTYSSFNYGLIELKTFHSIVVGMYYGYTTSNAKYKYYKMLKIGGTIIKIREKFYGSHSTSIVISSSTI